MYTLTLTADERRAINWVGYRYSHGDDLHKLLNKCRQRPDVDWDERCDITFEIPEHIAWEIGQMGDEGNYQWDCFAENLADKLTEFCMKLV